jgi:hypothetical protein
MVNGVPGFWLSTLDGIGLALLAKTLLGFQVVAAFALPEGTSSRGDGILAPLIHSARFGWKHFGW